MPLILHIALPVPLRHHFDYLADREYPAHLLQPGMRVLVPFGKQRRSVGILIGTSISTDIAGHRLKRIIKILDTVPLFGPEHLKLLRWASEYYHHPFGDLVFSTLPRPLKLEKKASLQDLDLWHPSEEGRQIDIGLLKRSNKQQAILGLLKKTDAGLTDEELNRHFEDWRSPIKSLLEKGLVEKSVSVRRPVLYKNVSTAIVFNKAQTRAFELMRPELSTNQRFLLDGITGSGKTEIYLEAIKHAIAAGKQALILVPEIGLTPHFIAHFRERIQSHMVVLHSGLSDSDRLQAWLEAREGIAAVVLGTRSAIWTPLKSPGLFIVDEEHDPSYKQQEGFRYSARDIAVLRANNARVPVILGSATPSLESLHNIQQGKFKRVALSERAANAALPTFQIVDVRAQKLTGALSDTLITAIKTVLDRNQQALLFLNRRGYSPVLMCHHCGWIDKCSRCNVPFTYHKHRNRLICHHCGSQGAPAANCRECGETDLIQIGHGTERLTETLKEKFPAARILRIDRDSTRRKGSMEGFVETIKAGEADILVGTQMLAKGHHFPGITLVGIIDADRGLYSADFRAGERMAQLITQVSGRAGRARDPGVVMIQTHFPEHPFFTALINHDYHTFARVLLEERKSTNLPP